MPLAPDHVRRARIRRGPLVGITVGAFVVLIAASLFPALQPWVGVPRPALLMLAAAAAAGAVVTWAGGRRAPGWTSADDVAWVAALASLSLLAAANGGRLGLGLILHTGALVALAMRNPRPALSGVAIVTTTLIPLVQRIVNPGGDGIVATVVATTVLVGAFVALVEQTRRLARATAERDLALAERTRSTSVMVTTSPPPSPKSSARAAAQAATSEETRSGAHDGQEQSWDALVERVRSSITVMAESAGVAASVQSELTGLAPPSNKIRIHLLRIAQEAATQAIRHSSPRSIAVFIRRGEGGVVLELTDDGPANEATRQRRSLASLRGRAAALGGTAEVQRADKGWVTRVRLPCEQLN